MLYNHRTPDDDVMLVIPRTILVREDARQAGVVSLVAGNPQDPELLLVPARKDAWQAGVEGWVRGVR